jgi:cytidylate kinase
MEGRPQPKTPVAKFTDAEVKAEAKRRSKTNKTEESVEFANVWREVKEARAAEATALVYPAKKTDRNVHC